MKEKFLLLQDTNCLSLNSDSYFYVMLANKDNFKSNYAEDAGEKCEIDEKYKDK